MSYYLHCGSSIFQLLTRLFYLPKKRTNFLSQLECLSTPFLRLLRPDRLHVEVVDDLPEDLLRPRRPALGVRHDPHVVRPQSGARNVC